MSILQELAAYARERTEEHKKKISTFKMKEMAYAMPKGNFAFEQALKKEGISFICECKKASPSKGLIAKDFPYLSIAKEYEAAGADCISVLTEPRWFLGEDRYLKEISDTVSIPCLRKDFTVDEYMIYEAKLLGASAVLLICSILTEDEIRQYIKICDDLGLSALVEAHDASELDLAIRAGARVIGVNNRNLNDFTVDTENSRKLRQRIPGDILFVSESGVKDADDIARLREIGADAVLIGETLMRAEDKKAKLVELKGEHDLLPRIKLCGLSREEDILLVNDLKPDYVGFVFWPKSKRFLCKEQAKKLKKILDPSIQTVGVFVDADPDEILSFLEEGIIDLAQLHGQEDEADIQKLKAKTKKEIIKAFTIESVEDIEMANHSSADYVLLDSGKGSGNSFDWELLAQMERPYFLAGGLNASNVREAIKDLHPYAVDVSSGIETNGKKDSKKMIEFVRLANHT